MKDQKLENLLNLALGATEEEREKSLNLDVGYHPIDREWELIIKYSGNLDQVRDLASQVVELQNEYAIIRISRSGIDRLSDIPEVEYIEKPKRLFFHIANGKRVSCINEVQDTRFLDLRGQGVLVAIIDSGIDYANEDFRNADGTTRIRALWDQSLISDTDEEKNPPKGYRMGVEFTQEQINRALEAASTEERRRMVPSRDISGHGTAVAGIAAGNGRRSGNLYAGVAPDSELIVVKMGSPMPDGFPRTTELMQALESVVRTSREVRMPVAINLSFGNTYGSHDGRSLLERYIDDLSNFWKSVICVGTGNEAASAGHTSGMMQERKEERIQLAVQSEEPTLNIQIWKAYTDEVEISFVSPAGTQIGPIQSVLGPQRFRIGDTEILLYYGKPSPYNVAQEIYIDMIPVTDYITSGVWQIILNPTRVVEGQYDLWLPSENVLNQGTGFLYPDEEVTLTIPSTAEKVISVGAYDALTFSYAPFSGRGYTWQDERTKPDLVAPGVNVRTTAVGGGLATVSGTSFATPFVTGASALLMEWGIVRGNDPFLYGEKVKAYLRRGARELPGFEKYPNREVGYGRLCLESSLPD